MHQSLQNGCGTLVQNLFKIFSKVMQKRIGICGAQHLSLTINLIVIILEENMTVKVFCKKYGMSGAQFYGEEKIEGSLYLHSLTSIPEGFNPTVGRNLYLSSLISIPEGFNPTVGRNLYLHSHLRAPTRTPPTVLAWQDGRYISVDGVFGEVISKHGDTYKCRWNNKEFFVVVVDGKASHGDTIKEAKADLLYKIASRDMSKYEAFTLNTPSI